MRTPPILKLRHRRPAQEGAAVRVRPVFDDFHLLLANGDYEYPEHRHANYELILVERGPYRCRLNGCELVLSAGQVLVVKPGDVHADHLRRGQRHYVLHFRLSHAPGERAADALFREGADPERQVCRRNHRREVALVSEIQREAEEGAQFAGAVQDCLLEVLFWRIVRDLPPRSLSERVRRLPQNEALRENLWALMERRVRENRSVRELAAEFGCSARHLGSLSRGLFGESAAKLFLSAKLQLAEEWLRAGRRVKEVSDELGFANPYHFSRVFKRHRGQPPSHV